MASSSLAPIRRKRMSRRPALASKYHFPLFLISGTGSGHSSSPTMMVARFGFDGSMGYGVLGASFRGEGDRVVFVLHLIAAGDKVLAIGPKDGHQFRYVIGTCRGDQCFGD